MNAEQLKALQAPLKERFRQEPSAAQATLRAAGVINLAEIAVDLVRPAGAACTPGLHPLAGGNGQYACAAEMLLEALIGCAGVTFAAVRTAMSLSIDRAEIEAEGDVDFRGTLGVDRSTPVGFTRVHVTFRIVGEATAEQLDKAVQLAERYCVVAQTLKSVTVGWTRLDG